MIFYCKIVQLKAYAALEHFMRALVITTSSSLPLVFRRIIAISLAEGLVLSAFAHSYMIPTSHFLVILLSSERGKDGKPVRRNITVGFWAFGGGGHSGNDRQGRLLTGVRCVELEVHIIYWKRVWEWFGVDLLIRVSDWYFMRRHRIEVCSDWGLPEYYDDPLLVAVVPKSHHPPASCYSFYDPTVFWSCPKSS